MIPMKKSTRKNLGNKGALPSKKIRHHDNFSKLVDIVKILRSKKGCPWDLEQTISSMGEFLSKEADEVKEAIEKIDHSNLKEELGDLLFNILLIARIAEEQKLFSLEQVLEGIIRKITDRHTWVFGKDKAKTTEEALALWHKNKKQEKRKKITG